jgi:ATP-dependent helicase/nuclease subunit A
LLVDWPVEAESPLRCAFVYAESACPPSLVPTLDAERQARQREELNGLYVAMSRAKERLVFSATEPSRRAPGPSWWQRIEPLAGALPAGAVDAPGAVPDATPARLKVLALAAPMTRDAGPPAVPEPVGGPDTAASRLGQAVHRVLEWATAAPVPSDAAWTELARAAALEFQAPAAVVASVARTVFASPQCARFFGGPRLRWAGNEVPVTDTGSVLRIDRLVHLEDDDGPAWWVLDYKLRHAPQQLDAYREQLLRYRDAVRRLQPGETVRCAFVTGAGAVVEIDGVRAGSGNPVI